MRAVNLIPSDQRSGGSVGTRSGGAAFLVLGLLAGLAVLALLYGSAHRSLESRRAEVAKLTAEAQQVQQQASRLSPYTSFMTIREQRLQAIAQLVGSRFDWSNAMGELSRVLPAHVALTAVQGAIGSAAGTASSSSTSSSAASSGAAAGASSGSVSSATPPGSTPTITLSGCASSQSVVAQTLVRLHLIAGVSAVDLESSTASTGGGSCGENDPVFSIQVSFQGLPTPGSAATAATASGNGAAR